MKDESKNVGLPVAEGLDTAALPAVVDRATFQAELDALRAREKAHTREGDAIAAARRRLPMTGSSMTPPAPNCGPSWSRSGPSRSRGPLTPAQPRPRPRGSSRCSS